MFKHQGSGWVTKPRTQRYRPGSLSDSESGEREGNRTGQGKEPFPMPEQTLHKEGAGDILNRRKEGTNLQKTTRGQPWLSKREWTSLSNKCNYNANPQTSQALEKGSTHFSVAHKVKTVQDFSLADMIPLLDTNILEIFSFGVLEGKGQGGLRNSIRHRFQQLS